MAELGAMVPTPAPDAGGFNLMEAFLQEPEGMVARAFMNPPSMALGPTTTRVAARRDPGRERPGDGARHRERLRRAVVAREGRPPGPRARDVARAAEQQSTGPDAVLQLETRFGLGFMLPQRARDARFGPGERAFGHPGAGGSLGFADPDARIGFGYAMNQMGPSILLDVRPLALIDALYSAWSDAMVEIEVVYEGDLHTRAKHGPSGSALETDAPKDNEGRGEALLADRPARHRARRAACSP